MERNDMPDKVTGQLTESPRSNQRLRSYTNVYYRVTTIETQDFASP